MYIANGYVFKRWFIYIGWIVLYRPNEPTLYADNIKTETIHNEYELSCMVMGLTQKGVIRKLSKHLEKYSCGFNAVVIGGDE